MMFYFIFFAFSPMICNSLRTALPTDFAKKESATSRRSFLAGGAAIISTVAAPVFAAEGSYSKSGSDYSYSFQPPEGMETSTKPLKTHLDEVNFLSSTLKGYQYGITVDPVRINSLSEFGTPEEVAARVVTAEVNRDGVFDVTLVNDPIIDESSGSYVLNYLSKGKRGDKHFVCKISVVKQKLYVLTAQVKEENYIDMEKELLAVMGTFIVK